MSPAIIDHFSKIIPASENILSDPEQLVPYLRGTEGLDIVNDEPRKICCVVIPETINDVEEIIKLANTLADDSQCRISLQPISSGRNWGYGTSQPHLCNDNIVIVDLKKLQHISFDHELGLVTIEPGVTQRILCDYLQNNNFDYMVPVTGAGPDCSIIGNAIERGYGITPYTDHFGAVTAVHGFWANGTPHQSAVYELDNSPEKFVDSTFKWGVGPYLDGLLTQSNFGIVTKMSIRLAKRPKRFISFVIQVPDDEQLENIVPLIRQVLREYEGIVGSINLMDKRRVLSMFAENPNPGKHVVMSNDEITTLSQAQKTPDWTIMGSIYGSKLVAKSAKREIKQIFSQLPCKQIYSDSPIFPIANTVINAIPNFLINRVSFLQLVKKQLVSFERGKEIMLGKPNKIALKLTHWRSKDVNEVDPESISPGKDQCGLLWYAPLITMKPSNIRTYVNFIRDTCPKFNIEPLITFTNLKHDCVDSTIPIVFDLSNEQAVKDAHQCVNTLVEQGRNMGFVPYRLNVDQQRDILDANSPFWQTTNSIKAVLDPNDIMNLGRYNPR